MVPAGTSYSKFYWNSLVQCRFIEDSDDSAYDALRKSSDCQASEGLPSCKLHKFSLERKRNNHSSMKIQEPSEREMFLLENATEELAGVAKDERASLFSASQSVRTRPWPGPHAPSLTHTPNNTIGLFPAWCWMHKDLGQQLKKVACQGGKLHCFQHRKVYEQDRGPVRMPRL